MRGGHCWSQKQSIAISCGLALFQPNKIANLCLTLCCWSIELICGQSVKLSALKAVLKIASFGWKKGREQGLQIYNRILSAGMSGMLPLPTGIY